ncbi:hypothetical protein G8C15_17255 [Enterococcus casseliflavus]|nr:hypothetical protein [Enterococcus casseliflavus]
MKSLIDKFLLPTYPQSFLTDIPLEEFYLPLKSYSFNLQEEDTSDENIEKMVTQLFRLMEQKKIATSIQELEQLSNEQFFQGVTNVTDHSQPLISGTRIVSVDTFLNHVLATPELFDFFHKLDS